VKYLLIVGSLLMMVMAPSLCGQSDSWTCAENDEVVGFPLQGWVGYTNTGNPISDMTVECFTSPDTPPVASVKTDAKGRFSFPKLSPGKYYLKATKKLDGWIITAEDFVTLSKGAQRIACLVADADESPNSQ
jgi:hypothetical protein